MSADAALPADLLIDGRYQLVARVSDWGVGECWRARDVEQHRRVMVKVLPAFGPSESGGATEFRSLARRLEKLQHRSVAATLASGFVQQRPYLVQEYLDGVSLGAGLARSRSAARLLEPGVLANLLDHAFAAVAAAHAEPRPLVHGALAAGSVVAATVEGRLVVRVLDFGLGPLFGARLHDRTSIEYVAPELDDLPPRFTVASDIFSLGAILAEAITDRRTASGGLTATVGGLSAVTKRRDDIPNALMGVASRATRHDPDGRFASVVALREAFASAWSLPAADPATADPPAADEATCVSWESYGAEAPPAPGALDIFSAGADAAPRFAPLVLPPLAAPSAELASTLFAVAPTPSRATFDATLIAKAPVAPAAGAPDATLIARPAPRASLPAPAAPAPPAAPPPAPAVHPAEGSRRRVPIVVLVALLAALLTVALGWALASR